MDNTWHRQCRQRVPPRAPALANVPGPRSGKSRLVGGPGPAESLASLRSALAKATCSSQGHLLPVHAATGARGEDGAMVMERQAGLPTPCVFSAGAQEPAQRWASLATPKPCDFSLGFRGQAPIQTQPGTRSPCPLQSCSSTVPLLPPVLSAPKPGLIL